MRVDVLVNIIVNCIMDFIVNCIVNFIVNFIVTFIVNCIVILIVFFVCEFSCELYCGFSREFYCDFYLAQNIQLCDQTKFTIKFTTIFTAKSMNTFTLEVHIQDPMCSPPVSGQRWGTTGPSNVTIKSRFPRKKQTIASLTTH